MASLDPGIGEKFSQRTQRAINHDGTFNVRRRGGPPTHDPYQRLILMPWGRFFGEVSVLFLLLNGAFALAYMALGLENLPGVAAPHGWWQDFLSALFFSVQTFTSVGYGHVYPGSNGAGALSSLEALVGVLTFALATGLLYGRFSRPTARILFSRVAVVSRRPDGTPSLQFRVANRRANILIELSAQVLVKFTDAATKNVSYAALPLERESVSFLPLTWTLVHDLGPGSPLHGLSAADYAARDTEIIVTLKGYDDTFAQNVYSRNSYVASEIAWYHRFRQAYNVGEDGIAEVDLDALDATEPL
ncbi:ion channel [Hymenobacter caeli]|uniref:Inward rectifier potassium channel n=1 Tax=Hymenobacter caeli TaxID=2735894 RepID=A0ABX2FN83_9BACT|nr:ion channel [Hymenobacter caeli]NRT18628.1 inward rectifier potassium channel [Hymenobacter caeli]